MEYQRECSVCGQTQWTDSDDEEMQMFCVPCEQNQTHARTHEIPRSKT